MLSEVFMLHLEAIARHADPLTILRLLQVSDRVNRIVAPFAYVTVVLDSSDMLSEMADLLTAIYHAGLYLGSHCTDGKWTQMQRTARALAYTESLEIHLDPIKYHQQGSDFWGSRSRSQQSSSNGSAHSRPGSDFEATFTSWSQILSAGNSLHHVGFDSVTGSPASPGDSNGPGPRDFNRVPDGVTRQGHNEEAPSEEDDVIYDIYAPFENPPAIGPARSPSAHGSPTSRLSIGSVATSPEISSFAGSNEVADELDEQDESEAFANALCMRKIISILGAMRSSKAHKSPMNVGLDAAQAEAPTIPLENLQELKIVPFDFCAYGQDGSLGPSSAFINVEYLHCHFSLSEQLLHVYAANMLEVLTIAPNVKRLGLAFLTGSVLHSAAIQLISDLPDFQRLEQIDLFLERDYRHLEDHEDFHFGHPEGYGEAAIVLDIFVQHARAMQVHRGDLHRGINARPAFQKLTLHLPAREEMFWYSDAFIDHHHGIQQALHGQILVRISVENDDSYPKPDGPDREVFFDSEGDVEYQEHNPDEHPFTRPVQAIYG